MFRLAFNCKAIISQKRTKKTSHACVRKNRHQGSIFSFPRLNRGMKLLGAGPEVSRGRSASKSDSEDRWFSDFPTRFPAAELRGIKGNQQEASDKMARTVLAIEGTTGKDGPCQVPRSKYAFVFQMQNRANSPCRHPCRRAYRPSAPSFLRVPRRWRLRS